jgi:hypothetical protein
MGNNRTDQRFLFTAEEKKAGRKLKEFLQTPHDEILEVFKELIFARNDVQPLIDGSTNETVSFTN